MYEFFKRNHSYLQAGFLLTFAASLGQTFYFALYAGSIRNELGLSHGGYGGLYTAATLLSALTMLYTCLLYTSPSPRDKRQARMPSSA